MLTQQQKFSILTWRSNKFYRPIKKREEAVFDQTIKQLPIDNDIFKVIENPAQKQKDQIIKTIQATEGKIKRSKNLSEKKNFID